ncbi:oligopeptide/dipeptide ABC transporter ATP-binding protein [uncultured Roseibium sp.]|uniref:ABC transporter ATP-binding protein n=1 Tax=uncultured Roseibium sp. TaxID=1936171 RepID=UPI00261689C1|nr:oligopeptide/dipeptide ABC transporter ATP-binding protein [uncultured Roseibium sp.]
MNEQVPLLQVNQVSRTFPIGRTLLGKSRHKVLALDGVSLELKKGETLGLVGESGCGKSTLAKLLVALDKPSGGEIHFEGKNLGQLSGADLQDCRKRIQMVFQDPLASLNPRLAVRASIAEPLGNFTALDKQEIETRIDELARQVGLSAHHLDRFPHELSGGQCQRVGIARAIACRPDVIVADEPVSALDVSIQAQILNLLFEIKSNMGLSIVFVSHDLSVVAHVADRVAVMYLGRIVEIGSAEKLFGNPRHPYTQMLLGALPHPRPEARRRRSVVKGELPSPLDPPTGCHFQTRCPLAGEDCIRVAPVLKRTETASHMAACHRLEEQAIGDIRD